MLLLLYVSKMIQTAFPLVQQAEFVLNVPVVTISKAMDSLEFVLLEILTVEHLQLMDLDYVLAVFKVIVSQAEPVLPDQLTLIHTVLRLVEAAV
jgi:hypothetical protein